MGAAVLDCQPLVFPQIVGLTAWGDRIRLNSTCGRSFSAVGDTTGSVWTPGPEARAIVNRLVEETR